MSAGRVGGPCLALAACLASGCGPGMPAAHGTVRLDGAPVDGATVRFFAAGALSAPAYFTVSGPDGTFALPPGGDHTAGLPPGRYKVVVVKYKDKDKVFVGMPKEQVAALKSVLPPAYADPAKTPLEVDLRPGDNALELALVTK